MFVFGKEENQHSQYGFNEEQYKDMQEFVHHLKIFDHIEPEHINAGNHTTFVSFKGDKLPSDKLSIHEGLTCEVTNVTPIKGTLHFWLD